MKLAIIYLISIVLLWINSWSIDYTKFKKGDPPSLVKKARAELRSKYRDARLAELTISYVTGDKRRLSHKIRRAHKRLGLYHLFTPSGIHLSAILGLFFLLLRLLKIENRKVRGVIVFLTCITPFFLPKMFSMKRISLMRFLFLITARWKWLRGVTPFHLFITSFLIDFFIGTYSSSPLSFSYSFLFLGIIMAVSEDKAVRLPWALFGGQIIISFFQQSYLSPIGPFFGFGLTALFAFVFPPLFLLFWIELIIPISISEYLITTYWKLVSVCSEFSAYFGEVEISLWMVMAVLLLSIRMKYRGLKFAIFIVVISFHSLPVWNSKKYIATNRASIRKNSRIYGEMVSKKITSRGFVAKFRNGKRCTHVLYEGGYSTSCRY